MASEYVLAVLGMFAFERVEDDSLVVAAGVSEAWLDDGFEIGVTGLPTYYGPLSYTMRRAAPDVPRMSFRDVPQATPSAILLRAPLRGRPEAVEVDGRPVATFDEAGVTLSR